MKISWIIYSIILIQSNEILCAPFAYITNSFDNTVSVIDLATNTVVTTIVEGGPTPTGIEITTNNKTVYAANFGGTTVTPIDTKTNTVLPNIQVGQNPIWVASATCDRHFVYVTNTVDGTVTPINTLTNTTLTPITVGNFPVGIDISNNNFAYVCNLFDSTVSVIDLSTNTVVGSPIIVGAGPDQVRINAANTKAYVTCLFSNEIFIIDLATNSVIEPPIFIGAGALPAGIDITPDDTLAYVTNNGNDTVSVIDLLTNTITTTIPITSQPWDIAIDDTGKTAYVVTTNGVLPINIATNIPGSMIPVGAGPRSIALTSLFIPMGKIKKDIFLDHTETVFEITWQASPSNPAFYRVYFQDTVVGTISAKCPLKFLYLLKRCSTTIPSLTMTAVAQD
ncbi:MAG TPA: hypothetical protein VLG50_00205, partial [Candidatus Saccharimonadales bacterium]|nr:hypothetical protein [Candidatus Saccharimonadales bacterium]